MGFDFDQIIVGGGLQGALLALALEARQSRIALIERDARLGGNHTWCFHAGDLSQTARSWVDPLVVHRWPAYQVAFPGLQRRVDREYAAITSERLHQVVETALQRRTAARLFLGAQANRIEPHEVRLDDGTRLTAHLVIDARGPKRAAEIAGAGYQKFLGLEVELARPHGIDCPILMDAEVEQSQGFHFVYTLPLSTTRLLVEDTYFSDTPDLERQALRQGIKEYVAAAGHEIKSILREEEGVLPMPWRAASRLPAQGPLQAGYRGGFFHPGTAYSFPVALRLAELLASLPSEAAHGPALRDFARSHRRQVAFCHLLNYMLFCWFPPEERWHIFQRFYRLPLRTIERFYALRLGPVDMARLVLGRPPQGLSLRYGFKRGIQR
jgi:lycopene beta-cyclase